MLGGSHILPFHVGDVQSKPSATSSSLTHHTTQLLLVTITLVVGGAGVDAEAPDTSKLAIYILANSIMAIYISMAFSLS